MRGMYIPSFSPPAGFLKDAKTLGCLAAQLIEHTTLDLEVCKFEPHAEILKIESFLKKPTKQNKILKPQ